MLNVNVCTCEIGSFGDQKRAIGHQDEQCRLQEGEVSHSREFGQHRGDATHRGADKERQTENSYKVPERLEERHCLETAGSRLITLCVILYRAEIQEYLF